MEAWLRVTAIKRKPYISSLKVYKTLANVDNPALTRSADTSELFEIAICQTDKAETALEFFKSVYRTPIDYDNPGLAGAADTPQFADIVICETDVHRELQTLNKHKSASPDGIHPAIVQPLAGVLAGPLTVLSRESVQTATLPQN
ncbi:unnamed protein product [Echinostoma caproni]|uniref:VOC family protein n=1 Tax=Echinostoma caproni TaxID=27848 RepID=A0A183AUE9_9TREM|nr:unnamed protein product [Echinostoma caproni]